MCVCVCFGGGGRGPNFSLLLLGGTKFWGAVLVVFAARQLKEKCQEQNVDLFTIHSPILQRLSTMSVSRVSEE